MHIGFDEDFVDTLDIPSPPRLCVVMTTRPSSNPGLATLTDGQRDCLRLVYNHMTSKDIARILRVSPHTVDMRLRTAMKALSVGSRIEAARLLIQEETGGMVPPDTYQSLIYHPPEIAREIEPANLKQPGSSGGEEMVDKLFGTTDAANWQDPSLPFSLVAGPSAFGPPRTTDAPVLLGTQYPASGTGAAAVDPDIGSRSLVGSRPWGERNDLELGQRLGWIAIIAIGSSLAFGSILAALAALKALI
jgi:DNA-binding CsgD family transcriptional regulator